MSIENFGDEHKIIHIMQPGEFSKLRSICTLADLHPCLHRSYKGARSNQLATDDNMIHGWKSISIPKAHDHFEANVDSFHVDRECVGILTPRSLDRVRLSTTSWRSAAPKIPNDICQGRVRVARSASSRARSGPESSGHNGCGASLAGLYSPPAEVYTRKLADLNYNAKQKSTSSNVRSMSFSPNVTWSQTRRLSLIAGSCKHQQHRACMRLLVSSVHASPRSALHSGILHSR
nr:hypothetical protein CFP56_44250 [Quercus suber]